MFRKEKSQTLSEKTTKTYAAFLFPIQPDLPEICEPYGHKEKSDSIGAQ